MIGQCPEDKDRMGTAWLWEQGTVKDFGGLVHLRGLFRWLEQSVRLGLGGSPTCRASTAIGATVKLRAQSGGGGGVLVDC